MEKGSDEEIEIWWYKLGIYFGTATFLVFYSPPTVSPFDPLEEYEGLDNGAHLDYYDDDDSNGDIEDALPWESDPVPQEQEQTEWFIFYKFKAFNVNFDPNRKFCTFAPVLIALILSFAFIIQKEIKFLN